MMKFSTGPMKQLLSLSPFTLSPVYKSAWIYRVEVDAHLLPQCLLYRDVGFACRMHAQLLQLWPTLCDSKGCSPPGSSVPGILQARILEWVAMPSSRRSSQTRHWTQVSCVSCIEGDFFTTEPPGKPQGLYNYALFINKYNRLLLEIPMKYYGFNLDTIRTTPETQRVSCYQIVLSKQWFLYL